jgi:radical SAM superfamily enzyme YgiQ (UPF0313 family)
MTMFTVALSQVNFTYGNNAYLPYSVGLLQASCQKDLEIRQRCEFLPINYLRENLETAARRLSSAQLLGVSTYIWNWEYSKRLIERVKELNANIFIVAGGPQIPHTEEDLFQKLPNIDVVVIGEGEKAFVEILRQRLGLDSKALDEIEGLVINENGNRKVTLPRKRLDNVSEIPSPYLTGVFEHIISESDLNFQVSQETHRGCPYSCTFCDWGSATMQKVKRFDRERIVAEYEWMALKKIEVLYNCDANYGLFPEDEDLTNELVATKKRHGFPKKFRAAYAKNSNDRVFNIAKNLNDAEMSKGVTLSLQSLDELTLDNIKRRNMKINDFSSLISLYTNNRIPTYTELIVGLPGETLKSFKQGVNTLFEAGQHDGLNIYPAMVLPNAQLNESDYKRTHGVSFVETPLLLSHGTREAQEVIEKYDIVISTNSMPREDWVKAIVFSWCIQAMHCMNLTQQIAIYLYRKNGLSYVDFYDELLGYSQRLPDLQVNLELITGIANSVSQGFGSFDIEDDRFGQIVWPVEEILFLKLSQSGFIASLQPLLVEKFELTIEEAEDLIKFQQFSLRSLENQLNDVKNFDFTWGDLQSGLIPVKKDVKYRNLTDNNYGDVPTYSREVVWYGRKGSTMKNILVES